MRNLIGLCLATLLLAACATTAEYGRQVVDYGKQAGSWIGQKVEALYSSEGAPSSVEPQADGGSIVQYNKNQPAQPVTPTGESAAAKPTEQLPASAASNDANTKIVPCTTRYRTDSTGTIRSWTIDGKGCKAVEEDAVPHP